MPKVFIIILNWNGKGNTLECLKSLEESYTNGFTVKIVVVDNASTDGSVKALKKYKVLVNKTNLGFAEGNNVGIRYALENKADYVMVLNNDTLVDKNLLVRLIEVAKENQDVGILSPKIYFAKGFEFHKDRYKKSELGRVIWSAGGSIDWDNIYGVNRGVDEVDEGQYKMAEEMDFATGACMFISAAALKQVGFFDKDYFLYLEDVDLSMRMKAKGWKVLFAPKAKLWHKVAQSSGIGSKLNDYFITRNRLLFGMKYAKSRTKKALIRESFKFMAFGRKWQRIGAIDYYLRRFEKGSWKG